MRSERQLMDQIDGSWRYRWFVGLKADDPVWDVTVFTKNRERLMGGEVSQKFFRKCGSRPAEPGCCMRTFYRGRQLDRGVGEPGQFVEKKDPPQRGTGERGRKMFRDTHESRTDPEARM